MSYLHTLADPSNILSAFDPVAGISDGTTVGITWVLRQTFGALTALDSNIQEITASNTACPSWLVSLSGSLLGTVGMTDQTTNKVVRFFRADDPGLTATTTANCIVYEFRSLNTISVYSKWGVHWKMAVSGQGFVASTLTGNSGAIFDYSFDRSSSYALWLDNSLGGTTTTMAYIPRIVFWRSSNVIYMQTVRKSDGSCLGAGFISLHPRFGGFSVSGNSLSGDIVYGNNANIVLGINRSGGIGWLEGITKISTEDRHTIASDYSLISSVGKLPNVLFSVSGNLRTIAGKVNIGIQPSTNQFVAVSSESLDNLYIVHSSIASAVGTIITLNGNYWLIGVIMRDGRFNDFYPVMQLSG